MRPSDAADAAAAFWRFSLAIYARPGAADALIALQDRAGCDINLILFGLWAGAVRARELDPAELAAAAAAVAELNGLVARLRALRRELRNTADDDVRALRRRLLGLELAAERRVQHRLAAVLGEGAATPRRADRLAAAEANLALCVAGAGDRPETETLREAVRGLMRRGQHWSGPGSGAAGSPQRRTVPVSRPNRSSTRPSV